MLMTKKRAEYRTTSIMQYTIKREELEESARKVFDAVLSGKFKVDISKKYSLNDTVKRIKI